MQNRLARVVPLLGLLACGLTAWTTPVSAQTTRALWRVKLPGQYMKAPPRLAPSGMVHAVTLDGTLHAITPAGKVAWTRTGVGRNGLAVGPDGTVYTGTNHQIEATSPSGRPLWKFAITPRAFIFQGMAVGPDGNLHVLTASGPGIFSLTPAGRLRWKTAEPYSRPIVSHQDLVFGRTPDGKGWQFVFSANGHLARVDLRTGVRTVIPQGTRAQPHVGADDSIYCGTVAYDAAGKFRWRGSSHISAVASNGDVFASGASLRRLRASDGQALWTYSDGRYPGLAAESPDGRLTVFAWSANSSTKPNGTMAVDEAGRRLWSLDLPIENRNRLTQYAPAVFSVDGTRAYISVATIGAYRPFNSYVYAIDLRGATTPRTWSFGRACRASFGQPRINLTGTPKIGGSITVALSNAPSGGTGLLLLGTRTSVQRWDDYGGAGCRTYASVSALLPQRVSSSGGARLPVAIPNVTALVGVRALFQWGVLAASGPDFASTSAIGVRVGR